ncbi:GNAT family N-acetyltransferase [Streptomyces globisporus]|uniref:GNAT family N-acetyltransferase n=1 Tax=Streptomyces albovinaceus subgroup TaxID=1482558 RepID=UPI00067D70DE|nr:MULTISPECIES: GNAT family N-acetyltransferase [Streptomyces]RDL02575.1 RimJ/RimL family protein N-acetyltransferase [Streptomyces sp. HB202]WSF78727.1 GNAT family N-acetyltransferase [Streptomyces globisporus]WSU83172.1 GNAT family N-acetyltransferase [Streptomyces globisporus]WSV91757.1 GNAT family N-acetyltransferase [Streptomyces globisporus]
MEHEGEIRVDPYGESTVTGPGGLRLRRWREEDLPAVLRAYEDPAMRRWLASQVSGADGAADWLEVQRTGWAAGTRFAFAVTESGREDGLLGNVVMKQLDLVNGRAEMGYWTTAPARGRGVASRALAALTDWAFTTFAEQGLTRLELLHQVDNVASCRVAERCGYPLARVIPALPPDYPLDGHVHVREAPAAAAVSPPADRRGEAAGTGGGRASGR